MYLAIDAKEMAPHRYLTKFYGLSTDTKPTTDLANGSIFIEIDTSTAYFFDEENEEWLQAASSAVDPHVIADAVAAYLDAHPEAVTTVQDGAITYAKLDSSLKDSVDDVSNLKNEVNAIADMDSVTDHVTPTFTFTVSGGGITSNRISIKEGDTITYNRTAEANGKLYGTCSLHKYIGDDHTYISLTTPETFTADQDMDVQINASKNSTSDISLEDLCVLASPCYGGNVTVITEYDIVNAVKSLQSDIEGKQDILTFDNEPTENSTNPVKSGGVYNALVPLSELSGLVDSIADLEDQIINIDASTLTWGVAQSGTQVITEQVQIKNGSKVTYARTEEATGNLYSPIFVHSIINGVDSTYNLDTGYTYTFDSDCIMYLVGNKLSTSTKTYEEIAVLAKECFNGTLKKVQHIDIVDAVKTLQTEMDGVGDQIAEAVAPALGGNITITPEWTKKYYYNSSLEATYYNAESMMIGKVDISPYVNAVLTMTTYANGNAFCGFTDSNDDIIITWHQTSEASRVIPINAKYLYISYDTRVTFSCVITVKNASIGVAYLDYASGIKDYDSTRTYLIGDLCVNDGKLLHCINGTTGTFDAEDWQETTFIDEFGLRDYIRPIIKLKGLTWNARGDSITAGSNGPSYVPIVSALLGFDSYQNSGVGGAYYGSTFSGAVTDKDVTTVLAGTNDFGLSQGANTLTAFETAIRNSISDFKANNPGKRLYLITPIPRFDKTENELELTLLDYVEKMEEVCSELNVPCLNLYERCGITSNNYTVYLKATQGDLIHPNAYGAMRIAVEIARFVSEMEAIHRMISFA